MPRCMETALCLRKRMFDLGVTLLLAWLWLPVVAISALLIWMFEGRPIFYCSWRRVFRDRIIKLVKFRTMVRNAAQIANRQTIPVNGTCFLNISENSELYTRIGRFLERHHFTELPQFFHVILGRMSVVGNRPLPDDVSSVLFHHYPYSHHRFDVLCGMVGPVQLVGRDNLSDRQRLEIEIAYAQACQRAYNWRLDAFVLVSMFLLALRVIPSWTSDGVMSLLELYSGLSRKELVGNIEGSIRQGQPSSDSRIVPAPHMFPRTNRFPECAVDAGLLTVNPCRQTRISSIPIVILCGGKGTRAYPSTLEIPKALLRVDGCPIVERVMNLFSVQGHSDFILSLGHLKEAVVDHFGRRRELPGVARIRLIDTGAEANTGDRLYRCRQMLVDKFIATYTDGICDVPIDKLLDFHDSHAGLATITSVPLPSQYGTIVADEHGKVIRFREKPILHDHWINAGFFVFDSEVFDHWHGHSLEQEVLPYLADRGLLYRYEHKGFFKSMDTHKDQQELELMLISGKVPMPVRREERRDPSMTVSNQ